MKHLIKKHQLKTFHYSLIIESFLCSEVIGYIKGKSAIAVARQFGSRQRNYNGEQLWARGYVSMVGFEESAVSAYIKQQEQLDSKGYDENGAF